MQDAEALAELHEAQDLARARREALEPPAPPARSRLEYWLGLLGGGPRRLEAWVAVSTATGEIEGVVTFGPSRRRLADSGAVGAIEISVLLVREHDAAGSSKHACADPDLIRKQLLALAPSRGDS